MKLGGFGPVDSISRFDQMKTAKADDVKTSGADASSLSKASAPRASRSSNVSKENAKDFSRILSDTEKTSDVDVKEDTDSTRDSLAGAMGVARAPSEITNDSKFDSKTESVGVVKQNAVAVPKKASGEAELSATEENVQAIMESLDETAQTELSMRHASMRDFLAKMKSEFGIEPNTVVKAFAKLDQNALMAPPEDTAQAVLAQLDLKPEQMPKAERFYREMLNQTGESALNETLAGVGAGMSLKVLSEQDVAMEKLQQSIAGLNDAFARRDTAMTTDAAVATPFAMTVMSEAAPIQAATQTATQVMAVAKPASLALEELPEDDIEDSVLTPDDTEFVAKNLIGDQGADKPADKSEKKSESKFAALGAALSAATAGLAAAAAGQSANGSSSDDSKSPKGETSKPREFSSIESALTANGFNIPANGEKSAIPLAAGTSTTAALAASMAGQNGDANATNAQDLVRHAQLLVKNGGGEMKMQLKPEGAGEVTLKVAVKDGQVAIQMMTENDSTKKMLESSLDDLKTSLAQHKLHVDALKIEVGGEMAKQRFEQAQQDANREQTRQMAQDFMSQFRQDREGFRQGFFESSGFKNYQQGRRNPTPELEPVAASSVSNGNKSSGGDRRLNLVA